MSERTLAHKAYNWPTVAEMAERLNCKPDFIRERIHKPCGCETCRRLPEAQRFRFTAMRKGRHYLIDPADAERYWQAHQVRAA